MSRPSAIALRRPTCTALTWSAWGRRRVAASPRGARVRQALVERLVRDPSRPVWAQTGGELGPGSAGLWPAPAHAGLPRPVVPAWIAITPKAVPAQQVETGALPRSSRTPVAPEPTTKQGRRAGFSYRTTINLYFSGGKVSPTHLHWPFCRQYGCARMGALGSQFLAYCSSRPKALPFTCIV